MIIVTVLLKFLFYISMQFFIPCTCRSN